MDAWKRWMSEYIPMYHAVTEIMIITSNRVPRSAGSINHISPPLFQKPYTFLSPVVGLFFVQNVFAVVQRYCATVFVNKIKEWAIKRASTDMAKCFYLLDFPICTNLGCWHVFSFLSFFLNFCMPGHFIGQSVIKYLLISFFFNNVKPGETFERLCSLKRKRVDDSSNTSSSARLHWQGCYLLGPVCPHYCLLFRARRRLTQELKSHSDQLINTLLDYMS